ncbi:MAG: hypothetical protein R2726_22735 [Acidimicrobiales bacterium]
MATPANEAVLLETAEAATGPQLAKLVAEYKAVQPKATLRTPTTFFESFFDDHGMYDGRLRARPDQGASRSMRRSAPCWRPTRKPPRPATAMAASGCRGPMPS